MLSTLLKSRPEGRTERFPVGETLQGPARVPAKRPRGLQSWSEHGRRDPKFAAGRIGLATSLMLLAGIYWLILLAMLPIVSWMGGLPLIFLNVSFVTVTLLCLVAGYFSGGRRGNRQRVRLCIGAAALLAVGGWPAQHLLLEPVEWPFTEGPVRPWTMLQPCLVLCGMGVLCALIMPRPRRN